MAEVILKNIKKVYPHQDGKKKKKKGAEERRSNLTVTDEGVLAVHDFNLSIKDKEFIVLVGPSGCGKSTTLRMVAGLEEITEGELYIDGKLMNDVAPKDRDIAMVFQNYALYPHMTVYENMAFSLKLRKEKKDIPFIITTEYVSVPDVVRTIKLGARDYLPKPVHRDYLLELAEDIFHPVATVRKQERQLFHRTSPMILKVEKFARLVAPSEMSVMILGANGTGKESVAQTIHDNSERYGKPFVAVNCGALPRELAASLFFGHEKGAFTGADTAKSGYFDLAKGGTLFLDEIGTMPHEIQSMLLRVLQENVYTPIGSGRERISDVRVISATNENMELAIKEGRFREDLYHRLNEFDIRQPSLEECPEDILPLAEFFRERFSKELKRETRGFTEDAKRRMLAYRWPGNVRELQNRVKRAVLVSENPLLELPELNTGGQMEHTNGEIASIMLPLKDEKIEKESIIKALQICNGHREQAARLLKINPATLYRKMKKYGLR